MGARLSMLLYALVLTKCAYVYFNHESLHRWRGDQSPLDLTVVEDHEKEEEEEKSEKVERISRMPCSYLQHYTI